MRLKSLAIKNFLSYGPTLQTVDFSDESIISFIGNNGHGKSALLESITWSIWGQARRSQGVSKSDDMLIHLGETLMTVSITIEIKNNIYQIERSCEKKNNRIYTMLSLFSLNEKTGEINNLSSAHQKDTQETIEKIIGINYDIFINTVYLKQGNSNEFSKKTAKERKDILCSLLKINKIEEIRQSILEDIKKINLERDLLIKLEEKLIDSNKKEYREELKTKFEALIIEIEITKKNYLTIENNEIKIKKNYLEIEEKLNSHLNLINLEKKEIEVLYATYKPLKINFSQYLNYQIQLKNIFNNKFLLESIHPEEYEKNLIKLDQEEKQLIEEYNTKKNNLDKLLQKNLDKEDTTIHEILTQSNESHTEKIKQQITIYTYLFSVANCKECPLCLTTISPEKKEIIIQNLPKKEKAELEYQLKKYTKDKEIELQQREENKKKIKDEYSTQAITLHKQYTEAISKTTNKKKELEELLKQYHNYRIEDQNIFFYEKNILEFQSQNTRQVLKDIIQQIYIKKNILIQKKTEELDLKELFKKIHQEYLTIINEKEIMRKKREEEDKKILEIKSYLDLLENQLKTENIQLDDIKKKIIESEKTLKIKSNLAHILSKNNLQASIIEEAIPFIEEESNRILEKLTNGTSKIYIESMRDLKSGTIKETLDIKIADPVGLRYYEFFSGGEAFRIDLALRIALIKLLTKCSGYSVKTFIIDEGFGSQDSTNLEHIIQTLYLLQSEFDLIIIISHLNDMKEQFPIQFLIQKGFDGSIIEKI